jgi:Protein of unknown function (DUF4235)
MGLIYKPFGIVLSILGGVLGRRIFDFLWEKVDDEDPPEATTHQTTWGKLFAAAAMQGLIFRLARVVTARWGAIGWHYLAGNWPGEEKPDPR